jgi:hypothetical protein
MARLIINSDFQKTRRKVGDRVSWYRKTREKRQGGDDNDGDSDDSGDSDNDTDRD